MWHQARGANFTRDPVLTPFWPLCEVREKGISVCDWCSTCTKPPISSSQIPKRGRLSRGNKETSEQERSNRQTARFSMQLSWRETRRAFPFRGNLAGAAYYYSSQSQSVNPQVIQLHPTLHLATDWVHYVVRSLHRSTSHLDRLPLCQWCQRFVSIVGPPHDSCVAN